MPQEELGTLPYFFRNKKRIIERRALELKKGKDKETSSLSRMLPDYWQEGRGVSQKTPGGEETIYDL